MGKNEFLTPKAIANRIKAKGLQKLRWYCQMCQKQCRDENGFKCHCMSEGHQRQMEVFGQNPTRIVEGYSEEFESTFLEHMKRSHRFSRVAATVVYNEYINDRHHVHMNSTQWATLTEFVKYLGRTGKCKVEETPKGWFMTYIDRDSETLFKERMKNKRIKADMADEEKQEKEIMKQIEKAAQLMQLPTPESDQLSQVEPPRELNVEDGVKIGFSLGSLSRPVTKEKHEASRMVFNEDDEEKPEERKFGNNLKRKESSGGKSTLEEMMRDEEKKRENINRKDYWLHEGIVVKVMSKVLAEKGYYNQESNLNSDDSSTEEEDDNFPISVALATSQMKYSLVASKQMVGIFVSVWMKKELVQYVGHLRICCTSRGIMGCLGNKGCISVSMSFYQTSFCFICSHLASGEKEGDELRRNLDVIEILKNTQFPRICKTQYSRMPDKILDHDRIIWFGDLNYRISLSRDDAKRLVEMKDWPALFNKDQLKMEREAGRVFKGWKEGKIYFAPTYKYAFNSDTYYVEGVKVSKNKRRTPAWCDRILWHGRGIQQLSYVRKEFKFSDHRPVCATFLVEVEVMFRGQKKKVSTFNFHIGDLVPTRSSYYS